MAGKAGTKKKKRSAARAERPSAETAPVPVANPYLACVLAWFVPGAGHLYLGAKSRALAFLGLVITSLVIGCLLDGRLPWTFSGAPLTVLASLGCLGAGAPTLFLRLALGYEGMVEAPGYEYGSAFILTAGLMNLLLILDAWDISTGRKT
ncbi:MAG: hypothetical protein GY719_42105 [bacterium]|nr:hypothetical protein [bacterium]